MRYLTDRKRAVGLGSAKSGTEHFWAMKDREILMRIILSNRTEIHAGGKYIDKSYTKSYSIRGF